MNSGSRTSFRAHARELGLPLAGERGALHLGVDERRRAGCPCRWPPAPCPAARRTRAEQRLDDLGAGGGRAEAALLHRLRELAVVEGGPGGLHRGEERRVGEAARRPRLLRDGLDARRRASAGRRRGPAGGPAASPSSSAPRRRARAGPGAREAARGPSSRPAPPPCPSSRSGPRPRRAGRSPPA